MTFLFISANEGASWGGSEELWSQAAKVLVDRGHKVYASVKFWPVRISQVEKLSQAGCIVVPRQRQSLHKRIIKRIRKQHGDDFILNSFPKRDLTIVSQGGNNDGLRWMKACQRVGDRYVAVAQAAAEQWWPNDGVASDMADCYEHAEAALFVSQRNFELTRIQAATELAHGEVIRNPFNVSYERSWSWPTHIQEELSLACVGRLFAMAKGQDLILQVLARPKWRGRSVTVSFYGLGENERALRRLQEMFKLNNIVFRGYVDSVEEIWESHHALLLPSRFEGLPLAIVEAMLCGRPCIVTDIAGNAEVVRDNDTGFIAKAATVDFLDEALERAWHERSQLKEYGRRAYEKIRQTIPPDPIAVFAEQIIELASAKPRASDVSTSALVQRYLSDEHRMI